MTFRRRITSGFTALTLFVGAAACADDNSSGTSPSASSETTISTESTSPAATTTEASASTTSPPAPAAVSLYGATPNPDANPDGRVHIGYAAPPQSVDPHRQAGNGDGPYTFMVFDRLVAVNSDFSLAPMLAESWEFQDGALELKLREGVTFNDGTPFNAEAVKVNIERGMLADSSTTVALSSVASVTVVDDTTVRLELQPNRGGELPFVLGTVAGAMVSPAALADATRSANLMSAPGDAGTGAYTVEILVPGERAIFTRVEGRENWDPAAGQAKTVEIEFVADAGARLNGVQAGDFDLAQINRGHTQAQELIDEGQIDGFTVQQLTGAQMMFNATLAPFDDPKVRQAIGFAVDRDLLGNGFYEGYCLPNAQYYPDGHPAHNPEVEEFYTFDPEKAKQLLAEAGVPDLSFTLSYNQIYDLVAQAVAQQLADVGINVTLDMRSGNGADQAMRAGEIPAFFGTMSGAPDPSLLITNWFLSGINLGAYDRAYYENLQLEANDPTISADERMDIYRDAMLKIGLDAPYVHFCGTKVIWAFQESLVNSDNIGWLFAGLPDWRYVASSK